MPVSYSLVASAAVDICAFSSVVIFIFSRPKRLKLPTIETYEREELPGGEDRKDPFDIASCDDLIDGYPLEEEKFWSQVRSLRTHLSSVVEHSRS